MSRLVDVEDSVVVCVFALLSVISGIEVSSGSSSVAMVPGSIG